MPDWILVPALYLIGVGFFHLVGGLSSASEALQKWGAAYAARRRAPGSSSL
jgi:hypothetical protein